MTAKQDTRVSPELAPSLQRVPKETNQTSIKYIVRNKIYSKYIHQKQCPKEITKDDDVTMD